MRLVSIVKKKVVIESKWEIISLGSIAKLYQPKTITSSELKDEGEYKVFGANGVIGYYDQYNHEFEEVAITCRGATCGTVNFTEPKCWITGNAMVAQPLNDTLLKKYLYEALKYIDLSQAITGTAQPQITKENLSPVKIPLPPLEIQEEIVKECEEVDSSVILAQNTIEDTKIVIDQKIQAIYQSSYPLQKLKDITSKIGSGATPLGGESAYKQSGITFIRSMNIYDDGFKSKGLAYIDEIQAKKLDNVTVQENDILFNITGASVARCCIVENQYLPARVNQHVSIIRLNDSALPQYVHQILIGSHAKNELLFSAGGGTTREAITKTMLEDFKIPLPSLDIQKQIVAEIETLETKITEARSVIESAQAKKEAILKKYL